MCSCGGELDDRHHNCDTAGPHSRCAPGPRLPPSPAALHRHVPGAEKVQGKLPAYEPLAVRSTRFCLGSDLAACPQNMWRAPICLKFSDSKVLEWMQPDLIMAYKYAARPHDN